MRTYIYRVFAILLMVWGITGCTTPHDTSTVVSSSTATSLTTTTPEKMETRSVEPLYVYFLDTGNSDAIAIQMGDKVGVIDAGDNDDEAYIVEFLQEKTDAIDFIVATHPDADHVGGLDAVVRNFPIKHVWVGNGDANTKTYQSFITALAEANVAPSVPLEESHYCWDAYCTTYFTFYNTSALHENSNDNSIIVKLTHGEMQFLFMGDASQEQEEQYMNAFGHINVVKVGHHGSSSSTSPVFIKKIQPDYAVILCGKDNKYGHPHEETLETLKDIEVYRTDEWGMITMLSDGTQIVPVWEH